MTIQFVLLVGVMICSIFTGLITEALKKMINDKANNIIAAVVSVIVGLCFGVCYCLLNNLQFDTNNIIAILLLIVCSWICAMVGYDKFKQTIEQIINK